MIQVQEVLSSARTRQALAVGMAVALLFGGCGGGSPTRDPTPRSGDEPRVDDDRVSSTPGDAGTHGATGDGAVPEVVVAPAAVPPPQVAAPAVQPPVQSPVQPPVQPQVQPQVQPPASAPVQNPVEVLLQNWSQGSETNPKGSSTKWKQKFRQKRAQQIQRQMRSQHESKQQALSLYATSGCMNQGVPVSIFHKAPSAMNSGSDSGGGEQVFNSPPPVGTAHDGHPQNPGLLGKPMDGTRLSPSKPGQRVANGVVLDQDPHSAFTAQLRTAMRSEFIKALAADGLCDAPHQNPLVNSRAQQQDSGSSHASDAESSGSGGHFTAHGSVQSVEMAADVIEEESWLSEGVGSRSSNDSCIYKSALDAFHGPSPSDSAGNDVSVEGQYSADSEDDTVDLPVDFVGAAPTVTLRVCTAPPGSEGAHCTVPLRLLVDPSSVGVRVFSHMIESLNLRHAQRDGAGARESSLATCSQAVGIKLWGPVVRAYVDLGKAWTEHDIALQVLGQGSLWSAPPECMKSEVQSLYKFANRYEIDGIIGIGPARYEAAFSELGRSRYHACSGMDCIALEDGELPRDRRLSNVAGALPQTPKRVAASVLRLPPRNSKGPCRATLRFGVSAGTVDLLAQQGLLMPFDGTRTIEQQLSQAMPGWKAPSDGFADESQSRWPHGGATLGIIVEDENHKFGAYFAGKHDAAWLDDDGVLPLMAELGAPSDSDDEPG